jgi:hypothetical protein
MAKFIRAIPDAGKRDVAMQTIKNLEKLNLQVPSELYDLRDNDVDIPKVVYNTDYEEIIEIKVKDIPKEVEKIQFVISW